LFVANIFSPSIKSCNRSFEKSDLIELQLVYFPSLNLKIPRPLNCTKGNGACLYTSAQPEAECARA
jgi:hypothetical protein